MRDWLEWPARGLIRRNCNLYSDKFRPFSGKSLSGRLFHWARCGNWSRALDNQRLFAGAALPAEWRSLIILIALISFGVCKVTVSKKLRLSEKLSGGKV